MVSAECLLDISVPMNTHKIFKKAHCVGDDVKVSTDG